MKKIAVPITRNNKIEEHFGNCEFYEIYTFSNANEILDLQLLESEKGCDSKSNLIKLLANKEVTVILSGGIGDVAINKLNSKGIEVIRGCTGNSADAVLQFIDGEVSNSGKNFSQQEHHHRHGHNHLCNV